MKTWNARARLLASVGLMALPLLILAWVASDGFSSASRIEEPALAPKESETATAESGDAEPMVLGEPAKRGAAADEVEDMGPAPVESTIPDRIAAEPTLIQAEKSPVASAPDGAAHAHSHLVERAGVKGLLRRGLSSQAQLPARRRAPELIPRRLRSAS